MSAWLDAYVRADQADELGQSRLCEALMALGDALYERDATLSDPRNRVRYGCCDDCPCHVGPSRDGQPCAGCVDVLDEAVTAAEKQLAAAQEEAA